MTIELRPYQIAAEQPLREALRQHREVLVVAPTGSGKSYQISWMAAGAVAKGKRALIAVPRIELLEQTRAALARAGIGAGSIAAGLIESPELPVQVGTVASLVRRLERWAQWKPDLLLVDEAHHVLAASWNRMADALPYTRLIGYTATPQRLDGKGLGQLFGAMVVVAGVGELIEQGWLSKVKTYCPPILPDLSKVRVRAGDYVPEDLDAVLADPRFVGDAIDHYQRLCRGAAVGYAISIEHSKALASAFGEAGFRARHVDAETPSALRRRTVAEIGADELDVLFNVGLFTEGLDLPALGGVIMLRPTLSASLSRQMCGRALRPAEGKSEALILDHVGNAIRHGLCEWDCAWTLADRQKRRRGREPAPVKRCPQCGAIMAAAARQCSNCHVLFHSDGEAPPISAPGRLVPAERQAQLIRDLRAMRWPEQQEWAGADYRRLRLVGQVRGYRHAWARHEYQRALDRSRE